MEMVESEGEKKPTSVKKKEQAKIVFIRWIGYFALIGGAVLTIIDWLFIISRQLFYPLYSFLWDIVANPGTIDRIISFFVLPFVLLLIGEFVIYCVSEDVEERRNLILAMMCSIVVWMFTFFGLMTATSIS